MEGECIEGSGRGTCYVMVDASKESVPLISTDTGYEVTFSGSAWFGPALRFKEYRDAAQNLTSDHNITVEGHSDSSHWNLCWKPGMVSEWQSGARRNTGVEDYCYYVNGLCFLWASPCTGGCSTLGALTGPLSNPLYATFCPAGLRFATEAEWTAAEPTLYANKEDFHAKCAAEVLDPDFNHCDLENTFKRVPNGGYEEQVLVCGDAQTPAPPAPTPPEISAIRATPAPCDSCSGEGEDCRASRCCSDPGMKCHTKNEHWAGCMATCTPGIHPGDPPEHRTPWTCDLVPACAGPGEDCSASLCCSELGKGCYKKDEYWAACKDTCTPGIDMNDPPQYRTPWDCELLGDPVWITQCEPEFHGETDAATRFGGAAASWACLCFVLIFHPAGWQ